MLRFRMLVVAAGIAAVATVASAGAATPKLSGTVGPGFTISLKQNGQKVKTLKAGSYAIAVADKSNIHNFHLEGPGLDKEITGVGFVGSKTVTVKLKKGTYTYVCDPHESTMKGTFKVT